MFTRISAIGWIGAVMGALMLAGTSTASAGDRGLRIGGHLEGNPGCMLGSRDCWIADGPRYQGGRSYRRDDRRYDRRYDRRHDRRYYRHDGPGVGIYLGVPGPVIRHAEPRRYQQRQVRLSRAHVNWCENRYRSYRAWDNTFQPYEGPRRQCWSPYS